MASWGQFPSSGVWRRPAFRWVDAVVLVGVAVLLSG